MLEDPNNTELKWKKVDIEHTDNSREIKEIYELLLVDPSKLVLNKDVGVADADDEDDVEDDDDEDDGSDASHHDNT